MCLDITLQRFAHVATILGGITVVITLWWGFYTYKQSSDLQADATAVDLMQKYFTFKIEHPSLARHSASDPINDEYEWYAAHNLLIAETIYKKNEGDEGWEGASLDIVNDHIAYVSSLSFPCKEYHPRFILFIQKKIDKNLCSKNEK